MRKYDKVRKIVKGSVGTLIPQIQITPMGLDKFMSTYKNIDPKLMLLEYYRYKNSLLNNQPYEPPGGNFTATQPNLSGITQQQTDNIQSQLLTSTFSLPQLDFEAMTLQALYNKENLPSAFDLPIKEGTSWESVDLSVPNGYLENSLTSPLTTDNGPSLKEKLTNFGTKNAGAILMAGLAADTVRNIAFANQAANDSGLTSGINGAYDAISTSLMGFAPVGTIIGGAMKVGALLGDGLQALGGDTDLMTTTDLIMDSSFFSWNIGAVNGFGGKRADKFSVNRDTLAKVGGSYGGTSKQIEDAVSKSGKKYGLFSSGSRRKANRQMADARGKQGIMSDIANTVSDQRAMINDLNYTNYNFNLSGGYDLRYMRAAKSGMKLLDKINFVKSRRSVHNIINLDTKEIEWLPIITEYVEEFKQGGVIETEWEPIIENLWEPVITEFVEEFKEGGKTKEELETSEIEETNQKNLIPEGALHKNKHHMEHTEGLTLKGIPVIDNDGELLAEIEHSEIIFTLEVTKKLEELYKDGSDEAAIEAGKLLVKEILFNTDDRTGLINKI